MNFHQPIILTASGSSPGADLVCCFDHPARLGGDQVERSGQTGRWYATREAAIVGAEHHAQQTRFSLRNDAADHRYEWGVDKGLAVNQSIRKVLRSGARVV